MKSKLTYMKKLELFKELDNFRDGQFYAVADQKIKNHLPQWIQFSSTVYWLREPEQEKSLEHYGQALEFFLKQGIHRKSHLHAIGGGATTDFAGFLASTILRGIQWICIPTTLLGMVDASIGGKVGINMPQGKNLVGAFHAPESVIFCDDFLKTLTEEQMMSGKGEILKYGFLSKNINNLIHVKAPLERIVRECANFKCEVVGKDFLDEKERLLLNLGHTLGHAFEASLKVPHGHAIAMGLKYLFLVMVQEDCLTEWECLIRALDLPINQMNIRNYSHFNLKDFLGFLEQDKKKVDSRLRLIMVKSVGSCYVKEVSLKEFSLMIQEHEEFEN